MRTALDHMGKAVGAYVGGVLAQATLAAVLAYIVLIDPRRAVRGRARDRDLLRRPRAAGRRDDRRGRRRHRHRVRATSRRRRSSGSIYSIVYQQVENTLIQPQIQKRAVNVHPFIVLVAVLFGSTLLGVLGALVAIPVAASVQIAIREWWDYRHDQTRAARSSRRRQPAGRPPPAEPPRQVG